METDTIAFQFIKFTTVPSYTTYINKTQQPAVGYNHTIGVYNGLTCSQKQAELWLYQDIKNINNTLYKTFPYQLNTYQMVALISLIQEITIDTFRTSKLYFYLLNKQYKFASQEFKKYDMQNTSVLRRIQEQNLFNYKGASHEL